MNLFFYEHRHEITGEKVPNFGDDLNRWLWHRLFPDAFRETGLDTFVGIGTILNEKLEAELRFARQKIVFGSGAGYWKPPQLDNSWKICCVRGPKTAALLELAPHFAITDPAILVSKFFKSIPPQKNKSALMPHFLNSFKSKSEWQLICQEAGHEYLDPRLPVEELLTKISQVDFLVTEAMHGAIVADTFRIPWIPIVTQESILRFKWEDWCASLNLDFIPIQLHHLSGRENKPIILRLRDLEKKETPFLSENNIFGQRITQFEEKILDFKNKFRAGVYQ